jgi:hypothetical protein
VRVRSHEVATKFTKPLSREMKRRFGTRWLSHIGVYANTSTFVVYEF